MEDYIDKFGNLIFEKVEFIPKDVDGDVQMLSDNKIFCKYTTIYL